MKFEWDQAKSEACLEKRGFDFEYVLSSFFDPNRIVMQDHRWDYGEDRFQLYGMIDGRLFFLVYTVRNSVTRIISARKANQREVTQYEINTNTDK
jgi:uncharacterized DUF497 family protein